MKKSFPSHIPQSLQSYVDQFRDDPERAIERLTAHVQKRGADAVGHYLLAWLHHRRNNRKEAIRCAWLARMYAPGSPLMERFHYFMTHPESLEAWEPAEAGNSRRKPPSATLQVSHPISDLDSLIERLSAVESQRIRFDPSSDDEGPDLAEASAAVDDIATETLATIHEKQGNLELAITTYRKLIDRHPERAEAFRDRIADLRRKTADN